MRVSDVLYVALTVLFLVVALLILKAMKRL
jgi:hypothetical protein